MEIYRRLRDETPVYFREKRGSDWLSRSVDVVVTHRDRQGFSSAHGIDPFTVPLFTDMKETTRREWPLRSCIEELHRMVRDGGLR
jgi:hypothetical protein